MRLKRDWMASSQTRRVWVLALAGAAVVLVLAIHALVPGTGVEALERIQSAANFEERQARVALWDEFALAQARFAVLLDFALIPIYVALLVLANLGARLTSRRAARPVTVLCTLSAVAAVAIGIVDVAENLFTLRTLAGALPEASSGIAAACTRWKWNLLALALLGPVAAGLARWASDGDPGRSGR